MLDAPPKESEPWSWLLVGLWSAVIFWTIPFARAFREAVADRVGIELFVYATVLVALLTGALAFANLRKRSLPTSAYLWLLGVITAFIAYAYHLREIPEEAIHVAEYGVLGFLVYRALVHRIHDYSIYFVATLIVGIIGMVDEFIQWVVPGRYFDLRDIRTNFVAGALTQVAIAGGLRPTMVTGPPSKAGFGRVCHVIALALFALCLSYVNTPERVAWYATRIPSMSFLLNSKSMMIDYGHRYHDPEIGIFQSRFSPDQLAQHDRERGLEVGKILDRYIGGEGYDAFQDTYTVPRDAYAHEAGVHLFRRNRYLERAMTEDAKRPVLATVALRENQILERYFRTAIRSSKHAWTDETRAYVDGHALKDHEYVSDVSVDLMTRFSEMQVLLAFATAIAVFLFVGSRLRRGERRSSQPQQEHRS